MSMLKKLFGKKNSSCCEIKIKEVQKQEDIKKECCEGKKKCCD